jgi:hypothetical protein
VRRALEGTAEVELVGMDWDERWAMVRFVEPQRYGLEQLRTRLMLAGAWCDVWPDVPGEG